MIVERKKVSTGDCQIERTIEYDGTNRDGMENVTLESTRMATEHMLQLDAYLMGYGVESIAEEELELERHNRY